METTNIPLALGQLRDVTITLVANASSVPVPGWEDQQAALFAPSTWLQDFNAGIAREGVDLPSVTPKFMGWLFANRSEGLTVRPELRPPLDALAQLYRNQSNNRKEWDTAFQSVAGPDNSGVREIELVRCLTVFGALIGRNFYCRLTPLPYLPSLEPDWVGDAIRTAAAIGVETRVFVWMIWAQKVLELLGVKGKFAEFAYTARMLRLNFAGQLLLREQEVEEKVKEELRAIGGQLKVIGNRWQGVKTALELLLPWAEISGMAKYEAELAQKAGSPWIELLWLELAAAADSAIGMVIGGLRHDLAQIRSIN